jgi:uncharacterized cupin superfamily protein
VKPGEYPALVKWHQDKEQNASESTGMTDNNNGVVAKGLWESGPGETTLEGEIHKRLQDDLPDQYDVNRL